MNGIDSDDISKFTGSDDPDLWYIIIAKVSDVPGKLKEWRKYRNLSIRDVEKATGISNPLLSQLENGKIKSPSFNIVVKLLDVYKVRMIIN